MKTKLLNALLSIVAGAAFVVILPALSSCTENSSAKSFGGKMTIDIPKGNKLENATWKEDELWYLYRPSREGEVPETHYFTEKSSFGVWEGTVIFKEQ